MGLKIKQANKFYNYILKWLQRQSTRKLIKKRIQKNVIQDMKKKEMTLKNEMFLD